MNLVFKLKIFIIFIKGHPEWIDFPREGNGWSHDKSIRRWDLADN